MASKNEGPLSLAAIIGGLIVTILGGVVVAILVEEGRFAEPAPAQTVVIVVSATAPQPTVQPTLAPSIPTLTHTPQPLLPTVRPPSVTPLPPTPVTPTLTPSSLEKLVQVNANANWVDSGISVVAGQVIQMSAWGQWSNGKYSDGTHVFTPVYGPDGGNTPESKFNYPLQGSGVLIGTLIGKVGNDSPFRVGSDFPATTMVGSGRLYLAMNDDFNSLNDNEGFVTVKITIFRRL